MKKIILNISDIDFEKFRFESILENKSISEVVKNRLFYKQFDESVEEALQKFMELELSKIYKEEI